MSSFAGEEDSEMKGRVLLRLKNVTELQDQLQGCLSNDYFNLVTIYYYYLYYSY